MRPPRLRHNFAAFSLIEAAIVLGIIGLVIGGIWAASVSSREALRVSIMTEGVLQAVMGVRRNFTFNDYPSTPSSSLNVSSTLIARNAIRADLVSSATTLRTPWGGGWQVVLGNYTNQALAIMVYGNALDPKGLTPAQCERIVRQMMSKIGPTAMLRDIYIATSGTNGTYYSAQSMSTITCPATLHAMQFEYYP